MIRSRLATEAGIREITPVPDALRRLRAGILPRRASRPQTHILLRGGSTTVARIAAA